MEIITIAFPILFFQTVYKKVAKTSKDNYKPVRILSNISKIYGKLMFKQISEYFAPILPNIQCGFRKGSLLTDLSKDFEWLSHELLLA